MKALTLDPDWAIRTLIGVKTVEVRSWETAYRGDLLICSGARKAKGTIPGKALCIVSLCDIVPFDKSMLDDACMFEEDLKPGMLAWRFENLRFIEPFDVKGRQRIFNVDGDVRELPTNADTFQQMYMPLITGDDENLKDTMLRTVDIFL